MWDGFSTRPPPEGRLLRSRGRVENPSHMPQAENSPPRPSLLMQEGPMEVSFEGICMWETASHKPGVRRLLPKAPNGATIDGLKIPPHTACIMVPTASVDDSGWSGTAEKMNFKGIEHSVYRLD